MSDAKTAADAIRRDSVMAAVREIADIYSPSGTAQHVLGDLGRKIAALPLAPLPVGVAAIRDNGGRVVTQATFNAVYAHMVAAKGQLSDAVEHWQALEKELAAFRALAKQAHEHKAGGYDVLLSADADDLAAMHKEDADGR